MWDDLGRKVTGYYDHENLYIYCVYVDIRQRVTEPANRDIRK